MVKSVFIDLEARAFGCAFYHHVSYAPQKISEPPGVFRFAQCAVISSGERSLVTMLEASYVPATAEM